jgi:hypothetical protein
MDIKTKFNIGQTVFAMVRNKVLVSVVRNIRINVTGDRSNNIYIEGGKAITYDCEPNYNSFSESEVFASKEELLQTL